MDEDTIKQRASRASLILNIRVDVNDMQPVMWKGSPMLPSDKVCDLYEAELAKRYEELAMVGAPSGIATWIL